MQCIINSVGTRLDIKMSGQCSFSDYDYYQQVLDAASSSGMHEVRVFLNELNYIDSSGLGMLLMLRERCARKLTLIAPKGQVEQVLRDTRLIDAFHVLAEQCADGV